MAYRTFGEIRSQIERELDLETEDFVQDQEMIEYFNSAIRETEAEILKLGLRERYLIAEEFIDLDAGEADYELPENIIDQQVRKIIYRNGSDIRTLKPLKGEESFEAEDVFNQTSTNEVLYYTFYKTDEATVLRLVPKPAVAVDSGLRVIYHKDLNRFTDADDECDVPEIAYEFIRASVKFDCVKKEIGRGDVQIFDMEKERVRALMIATLQGQVADPEMEVVDQDLSIYEEMS